jgi:glucose/arabinose dehydrogenase
MNIPRSVRVVLPLAILGLCACSGGSTVPSAPATASPAPATPTPTGVTPSPRGVKVVDASEPVGVVRRIPDGPVVGGAPRMPAQYRVTRPDEIRVDTLVTGLEVPWSLAFAPDGRLFVSERPGRVRIVRANGVDPTPFALLPVLSQGEGGLMGLAVDPDFAQDPWVYVCYTYDGGGTPQNRISRLHEVGGIAAEEQILLDRFPGAVIHDGCRLKFAPDGTLYATTGDATERSLAQNPASFAGKILRLNRDGTIPADNPFAKSPVYSLGHRNAQGLAFDPQTGALFATEHGPSGEFGLQTYDEVNIIARGGNYGWPLAVGAPGLPELLDPLLAYIDSGVPPAGATFYTGSRIRQWTGDLLFASLRAQHLQRIVLDSTRRQVSAIERLFEEDVDRGLYGRLRDVIEGPDGAVYVATRNGAGRAPPTADDDRILRLVPAGG